MSFEMLPKSAVGFAGREARTITSAELVPILASHAGFVARAPGGRRAILKFTNLSGLDLSGICLAEGDLSGALLRRCKLNRADLRDANLFGADLTRADLTEACLESADLRGATLRASICARAC